MNKTYISSLMIVLMAGMSAMMVHGQEDDFAYLDDFAAMDTEVETAGAADMEMGSMDQASEGGQIDLYQKGVALYEDAKYDQALIVFKAMIAEDPYDSRAMNYLQRTAQKKATHAESLRVINREVAITEVLDGWNEDYSGEIAGATQKEEPKATEEDFAREAMVQRLKDLVIPILDFQDANVQDAILALTDASRRMDAPSHNGINMILLGLNSSAEMGAGPTGNNITISIRNMNLFETLRAISDMADLRFEVEANAVYIMPYDYVRSVDLVDATFDVISEVGDELASMAGSGGGGDAMDDLFGESTAMTAPTGPVPVADYFSNVPWPTRAEATYYPTFGKLEVKNTVENIKKVEKLLDEMTDKKIKERSNQVEIEAKFVEFSEGAFEELGFNYNVYGSGTVGGFEFNNGTPYGSTYAPKQGIDADDGTLTSTLTPVSTSALGGGKKGESLLGGYTRIATDAFEPITAGILSSMGGTPPAMIFSNGDLDVKISALEQEGTADVLSSPRITTANGREATIRVVEIHRYPQDYDVETGQRTAPVVKPQDWEDFDLGVVLRVTPDIDPEKGTIILDLEPEIRKFKGFEDYAVAVNSYYQDEGNQGGQIYGDGNQLFARIPYFEIRAVSTRVTVADGHTVVMGGLIDERTETFRDQIPILGDIPYVGRLFRTEGSRTEKKNLVIYIKATQVDESGMTSRDRELVRNAGI